MVERPIKEPKTLNQPASGLTDEQLDAEEAYLDQTWAEIRAALEESGGAGGSPGEWVWERQGEIDTARQRRKAVELARAALEPAAEGV